jgi:UDP:flavonoid glycosyltransferase YjiC (YdhE family)
LDTGCGHPHFGHPRSDLTGKQKRIFVQEVRAMIFKILSDDSFTVNAKKLSERTTSYGGAREAADLIERIV